MDKRTVNLDRSSVYEIINDMHTALKKYGLKDNHIALFGSFLKGNHHNESDIDMIIVSDSFEGRNLFERMDMTLKAEFDVRSRYIVPMDIILKTPGEYEYSKKAYFDSELIV
jgi:predicted nucleotidyltransferase